MNATFNRDAPPGFRGLQPHLPIRVYYRKLPHWRQDGATYFVTFRLADALPQEKLQFLKRLRAEWERRLAHGSKADWESYSREVTSRTEAWSDQGYGECWFEQPAIAQELRDCLLHFHGERYHVGCLVVMPNHCHAVIRPFEGGELETILQGVKSIVSKKINVANGTSGQLWQAESYDRIIRDDEHLWRVVQYIGSNPRRAGIIAGSWHRWIAPEWVEAGWDFFDGD